ncbi:hypothetical protein GF359_03925 [candidate division WOR-3 bacterium]|uniref:Secretion system C-terminal sorting domain-containing protein n=1 Tax=candidate division WOR-3 bacterium TaxID=2052148 RepID=A0A9D5KA20_UNCW3|nr:hypothetical protein [candidate division WOR-3 bacterium]MBD3364345.1 hypothetical protein [candidate division WOR-3 bacterium]
MKKSLVFLLTIMVTLPVQAGWIKAYGTEMDEIGQVVEQTTDGGYLITGATESSGAGGFDAWIVKTDDVGDIKWTKTYGGMDHDMAESVQQTDDGGYIITGFKNGYDYYDWMIPEDLWLIKTDANGDTLWTKTYGVEGTSDIGFCVRQTSDGGYIISCGMDFSQVTHDAIAVMKTDASGDSLWTYRAAASTYDVKEISDGNYIVTGSTYYGALFLLKIKPDGTIEWEKNYEGSDEESYSGYCIQEVSGNGFIISGTHGGSEGEDILLARVNSEGDTVWTRTYGENPQYDRANWVLTEYDGNYIFTGSTETWASAGTDLFIIKTDSAGNIDAVLENPITDLDFEILTTVGNQIVLLMYSDRPEGISLEVFDASGRMVDEIRSLSSSGTVSWGQNHTPGVYFIKEISDKPLTAQKVILVR